MSPYGALAHIIYMLLDPCALIDETNFIICIDKSKIARNSVWQVYTFQALLFFSRD